MERPFDAVLIVSFGGPQGMDDIRPFLANVLRGRRVAPERVERVAHHYELFGGVSPLTELTLHQAEGLRARLQTSGPEIPVYVGMRNWKPYLADTLARMADSGVRRAIGFIAAAHRGYSSCTQYRENVRDAQAAAVAQGHARVEVAYVGDWYLHPGFVQANADHVARALGRLTDDVRDRARLVFTAHSVPLAMAQASRYREQIAESAAGVAAALGRTDWAVVYQSRSGRPEDPWLEPDVCDYLRTERARGLEAAVLCPIGFVCDHVEVLYDLDHEAAAVCREIGLPMARAHAVNDAPAFLDAMADTVRATWEHHRVHRVLPIVGSIALGSASG